MENIILQAESQPESQYFSFVRDKAFGIALISRQILSRLDLASLKNMRLVSKSWREMAHYYILEREFCRVEFKTGKYSFRARFENLWFANPDKVNFPVKVPSAEFIFTSENLVEDELGEFLQIFGEQIKKLSLELKFEEPIEHSSVGGTCSQHDLFQRSRDNLLTADLPESCIIYPQKTVSFHHYFQILAQSPNLEELTLDGQCAEWSWSEFVSNFPGGEISIPQLEFPHLRKIILTIQQVVHGYTHPVFLKSNHMAYKIIMAAPNLTAVENLRSLNLKPGDDITKFEILKNFSVYQRQPIEDLEAFAAFGPKLEILSLSDVTLFNNETRFFSADRERLKAAIYRILESSATTLETFVVGYFFRFPEPLFPTLHKLDTLTLFINGCNNICHYFDQGYLLERYQGKDLQEKLPNLKTLRLEFGDLEVPGDEGTNWGEYLPLAGKTWRDHGAPFQNCLDSMENLEISLRKGTLDSSGSWFLKDDCSWIEMMRDLFPSVKRIVLKDHFSPDLVLPALFRAWPNITSLVCDASPNSGYTWDSALSGLPWDLCEELDQGEINIDDIDLNYQEALTPSLHSLKKLQTLDLKFRNFPYIWTSGDPIFPISKASVMAAFDRLPHLNVTLYFDRHKEYGTGFEEYLSRITPRLTLAHFDDVEDWSKPET